MSVKRFDVHPDSVARAIGGVSLWAGPVSVVLASDYDVLFAENGRLTTALVKSDTRIREMEAALREIRDQGVSGIGYREIIRRVLSSEQETGDVKSE